VLLSAPAFSQQVQSLETLQLALQQVRAQLREALEGQEQARRWAVLLDLMQVVVQVVHGGFRVYGLGLIVEGSCFRG
jgi:ribosomal silencing factor RsfS